MDDSTSTLPCTEKTFYSIIADIFNGGFFVFCFIWSEMYLRAKSVPDGARGRRIDPSSCTY